MNTDEKYIFSSDERTVGFTKNEVYTLAFKEDLGIWVFNDDGKRTLFSEIIFNEKFNKVVVSDAQDWKAQMLINVLETNILRNENITDWVRQMQEINRIKVKSCLLEQRIKILNKIMEAYMVPEIGKFVLVTRCGMKANAATHKVGEVVGVGEAMHAHDHMKYWGADILHAKFFIMSNDCVYGLGAGFKIEILN